MLLPNKIYAVKLGPLCPASTKNLTPALELWEFSGLQMWTLKHYTKGFAQLQQLNWVFLSSHHRKKKCVWKRNLQINSWPVLDYYFNITKQNFARMFSKTSLKLSSLAFYTIIKILLFCSFKKCPITAAFIYSTDENAALSAWNK